MPRSRPLLTFIAFWFRTVIGEARRVFITPKVRPPMKTTTRSTPAQLLPPPPVQQRQLTITFETPALLGLAADHRAAAIRTLAAMLMQARDVHLPEDDDAER